MSERDGYPHGVPHWTTCLVTDLQRSTDFYRQVMGWEFDVSPDDGYAVATLRDKEVAGLGTAPADAPEPRTGWFTEVRVDDAAATAEAVRSAGGTVLSGPVDLSPASIMAVVADPAGAVLCATQPVDRSGAQLVNEPGAWSMSALSTPDLDAVAGFYRTVFGWEVEAFGPMGLFRLPGYVGGEPTQPVPRDVIAVAAVADRPARWDVDFWCADVEAAAAAAVRRGGAVMVEPYDDQGLPFRRTVLRDPDGSPFALSQLKA